MSTDWQVATRKGKKKIAAQLTSHVLSAVADLGAEPLHPAWDADSTRVGNQVSIAASENCDAPLARLQQQVQLRLDELRKSTFLHSFWRLYKHVSDHSLLEDSSQQCSPDVVFTWDSATDFVIYGLGSPAAGTTAVNHKSLVLNSKQKHCSATVTGSAFPRIC